MLKEVKLEDIPLSGKLTRITPMGIFANEMVHEFIASDMDVAEVTGWPDGDPDNVRQAQRCANYLRNRVYEHRDIKVIQRGMRVFLQRYPID